MTSPGTPRAPRVLAVDLSLKATGLAAWDPEWNRPVVWTFPVKASIVGHEREVLILRELARAAAMARPELILIEDAYSPTQISAGFISLMLAHGVVRHALRTRAPLHVVNNQHIKIYGTGRGDSGKQRGGDVKIEMIASAVARYGHLVEIADDNQADALHLLTLGLAAYGHPIKALPGYAPEDQHLRAIEMAGPWPLLAGHEPPAGPTAMTSRRPGRATRKAKA